MVSSNRKRTLIYAVVAAFVAIILIGVPMNAAGATTHSQSESTSRSFSAIYGAHL